MDNYQVTEWYSSNFVVAYESLSLEAQTEVYLRSKCMDKGVQSAIQKDPKGPAHINRLAHQVLVQGGAFGIDTSYLEILLQY